jgi:peptidylprolyl isomerase
VTVTAITHDTITLDANHPLAGKTLTFELELIGIS